MLVLIDNFDSFTYNLVQALGELGADIKVFRNNSIGVEEVGKLKPDHILISPGPCTPNEAGISIELIKRFAGKIPILGVCLGHQSIGQAFGAKVIRDKVPTHGKAYRIANNQKGVFQSTSSHFLGARYHSLVIDREDLPDCFEVTAWYEDLIMGIRHTEFPMLEGIQFHPESFLTEQGDRILRTFLNYRI